jgi:hypothetical protein
MSEIQQRSGREGELDGGGIMRSIRTVEAGEDNWFEIAGRIAISEGDAW